jgi:hypothetical protein
MLDELEGLNIVGHGGLESYDDSTSYKVIFSCSREARRGVNTTRSGTGMLIF